MGLPSYAIRSVGCLYLSNFCKCFHVYNEALQSRPKRFWSFRRTARLCWRCLGRWSQTHQHQQLGLDYGHLFGPLTFLQPCRERHISIWDGRHLLLLSFLHKGRTIADWLRCTTTSDRLLSTLIYILLYCCQVFPNIRSICLYCPVR